MKTLKALLLLGALAGCGGGGGDSVSVKFYGGVYDVNLEVFSDECGISGGPIVSTWTVNQDGSHVVVDLPSGLTINGLADEDGFTASGEFTDESGCRLRYGASLSDQSPKDVIGLVTDLTCGNSTCHVGWVGNGVKRR